MKRAMNMQTVMSLKDLFRKRRVWIVAGVVILVMISIILFGIFRVMNNFHEPADILRRGYLEYIVEADGLIESAYKTEVYAPSGLQVSEIFVKEGDTVQVGDLLARLDTEALELEISRAELSINSAEANMSNEQIALTNSVTGARNALSIAEVALQTARREYGILLEQQGSEAIVSAAAINLNTARRAYENSKMLYESDGISEEALTQSKEMLDKAQSAYDDAVTNTKGSLDRARETLSSAQIRQKTASDDLNNAIDKNTVPAAIALDLQRVSLEEKQLRLRDASITAASDGIVTVVNAKEGAPASGLMFIIENNNELIVRARVAESDVAAISIGTLCSIRPVMWEQTLDGIVTRLPYAAERDITGAFSAVVGDDAYFIVEAAIENIQPGILIGMNVNTGFIIDTRDSCFAVPKGLLYRDGERLYVLTHGNMGKTIEIEVQTGLETRRTTEIISDSLYEGMPLYSKTD